MAAASRKRADRRSEALTRAGIVAAAVDLLDDGGTEALSFRALAAALSTGAGAIYHHVASKGELLAAAAASTMAGILADTGDRDAARGVREVAMAVFDAVVAHPWFGTQLVAAPWQPAVLDLLDRVGAELAELDVPAPAQFDAASTLVHHVLGVASQYDATRRLAADASSRPALLKSATAPLAADATRYPFLARLAHDIVVHDDRAQFRAGIEIILTGIAALTTGQREATPAAAGEAER